MSDQGWGKCFLTTRTPCPAVWAGIEWRGWLSLSGQNKKDILRKKTSRSVKYWPRLLSFLCSCSLYFDSYNNIKPVFFITTGIPDPMPDIHIKKTTNKCDMWSMNAKTIHAMMGGKKATQAKNQPWGTNIRVLITADLFQEIQQRPGLKARL